MPKKISSTTTPSKKAEKKEQEEPLMEQKKQSSNPKKSVNVIDEIFAGKKRKKPEQKETENPNAYKILKPKSMKKKKKKKNDKDEKSKEGFNETSSRPPKRTADGFAIYTEEELGINNPNSGNTPLCPFDCDCCF